MAAVRGAGGGMSASVYTWDYRLEIAPYDRIMSVLEAFYASYPGGDYTSEHREKYKQGFRRGAWKRAWWGLGDWVPERLVKGEFALWPVRVRVLVRPSPKAYTIAVRYEVHLPGGVKSLSEEVQASVDEYVRKELGDLATYLGECTEQPPPKLEANG